MKRTYGVSTSEQLAVFAGTKADIDGRMQETGDWCERRCAENYLTKYEGLTNPFLPFH